MAENTIDNLSIQVTLSAEEAAKVFDRLASSAGRVKGAASGAAGGMQDMAQGARDAGTETQKAGEQTGKVARRIRALGSEASTGQKTLMGFWQVLKFGPSIIGNLVKSIARIALYRAIRSVIKDLGQSFKDLYGWSKMFGTDFAGSMDRINTAFVYLRNSIAAMVAPLVNMLAPALDFVINKIVEVLNWFNQFFAAIAGQSTWTAAKKVAKTWGDSFDSTKDGADKARKSVEKLKRTILGFDEINKLNSPNESGSSSGGGSGSSPYSNGYGMMFEERELSGGFKGFSNAIENALSNTLSRIGLIVSGALLAVGAILTFSGANVPLGLSMMAAGAAGLVSIIGMNWDSLSSDIKLVIGAIEAVVGGALLGIGAVLAFSGVKIGLGIAMMAAGAVSLAAAVGLNWNLLTGKVSASAKGVIGAISAASMALGAILAFSGVNVPLGVALLAAGATGAAATLSWDWLNGKLRGKIATITAIVSGSLLAIGAILAFSGVALPLGLGMLASGAVGLATTATANWDVIANKLRGPIGTITELISGAILMLGMVAIAAGRIPLGVGLIVTGSAGLTSAVAARWDRLKSYLEGPIGDLTALLSGALLVLGFVAIAGGQIPLGVGLIVGGASGLASTIAARWDRLKSYMDGPIGTLTTFLSGASLVLGFVAIAAGHIPLGVGLIVAGAAGLAPTVAAQWNRLKRLLEGPVGAVTALISGATLALGILALIAGNIPLGLGLLLSGAAGLAGSIAANWDNLKQLGKDALAKVKEGWDSIKNGALSIAAKISTTVSELWESIKTAWYSSGRPHVLGITVDPTITTEDGGTEKNAVSWRPQVDIAAIKREMEVLFSDYADFDVKVDLIKDNWTSVAEWVNESRGGNNDQYVELKRAGWSFIDNWARLYQGGQLNQLIGLARYGWSLISNWSGQYKGGIVNQLIGLVRNGWSYISGWSSQYSGGAVNQNVGLARDGWYSVDSWAQNYTNGDVEQGVKLSVTNTNGFVNSIQRTLHSWFPTLFAKGGVITAGGAVSRFAYGGIIHAYAGGTSSAHGSLFLAGEAGPEIVGHVGGRTEVLNKSQIASAMYSAVQAAMAPASANFAAAAYAMNTDTTALDMEMFAEMVRQGVESAMERERDILRQQLETLRQINDKDTTVEVSTSSVNRAQSRMNRRMGKTIVPVGT